MNEQGANMAEESVLVQHALSELFAARLSGPDYEGDVGRETLRMVREFEDGNHSGGSHETVADILGRLLRMEPLTPLTFEADEWVDRSEESGTPMWQNRRDPKVFSEDHGETWTHLDGCGGTRGVPAPEPICEVVEWDVVDGGILGCLIVAPDGEIVHREYRRPTIDGGHRMWDEHRAQWSPSLPATPGGDEPSASPSAPRDMGGLSSAEAGQRMAEAGRQVTESAQHWMERFRARRSGRDVAVES